MASGEARQMKKNNPNAKIVVGNGIEEIWSEIFEGNPHISRVDEVGFHEDIIWLKNYVNNRPYLDYDNCNGKQAFLNYTPVPGNIYFSEAELTVANGVIQSIDDLHPQKIYIEPNVDFGLVKDWGFKRYQNVVNELSSSVSFIQPDYGKQQLAQVELVSTVSFRQACAVLQHCDLYVGPEGGMHHAAAALGIDAIVLFGGRVNPDTTGYSFHRNLYVDAKESPCGAFDECDHCKKCFDQISVEDVIYEIRERLKNRSYRSVSEN